ncbi:DMT family transporter [Stakelama sediminis]|uniref:Drug/metabolite transporter (DMT)-like permease n=1 Tax=Stakelama sediminis TaxID=463200 RepID=A0A840Z0B5_9SPHN|nr:DMT family transporter [Stakelama sediminis]MBB5719190.1 drug/metabolite transporter (DMT)-like permease [Stakelama sediminis]
MNAVPSPSGRAWLLNALITVVLWGFWGAFSSLSPEHGFPETLVYCVWALTMIPPAFIALRIGGGRLDRSPRAIAYGMAVGLLGAGGQMVLFYAVTRGPAYLIFPIISLSPLVTIVMSFAFLGERTGKLGIVGIVLALIALPIFNYSPADGGSTSGAIWFFLALIVMLCWGVQAYFMKSANNYMSAEGIFFYMMIAGLLLVPVAWVLTDRSQPINWGWDGPALAAGIQVLNAIGALTLVFAFRYGKAIIVAPLSNAGAPLATAIISLIALGVMPGMLKVVGLLLALAASVLLAIEPDAADETAESELEPSTI